jgi:RNA polymerase sigma-70 factor (ECF subfamily)
MGKDNGSRQSLVLDDDWTLLMAAGQRGDERSYRQLLWEVRGWLVRYHARRLPPALVDDAVQETLLALHERRATYNPSRPFHPWLVAIARYKGVDQLREAGRGASEPLPDDLAVDDHESLVMNATLLGRLMGALKPAQAEVIRLVKLEGYSIVEASLRTGQSNSLVKMNIHRGLARLSSIARRGAPVRPRAG